MLKDIHIYTFHPINNIHLDKLNNQKNSLHYMLNMYHNNLDNLFLKEHIIKWDKYLNRNLHYYLSKNILLIYMLYKMNHLKLYIIHNLHYNHHKCDSIYLHICKYHKMLCMYYLTDNIHICKSSMLQYYCQVNMLHNLNQSNKFSMLQLYR